MSLKLKTVVLNLSVYFEYLVKKNTICPEF
jgi:hypothetical protein